MKDKRIIRIQNLKLQKIRIEFRKLWLKWAIDTIHKLSKEMDSLKIYFEGRRINIVDRDADILRKYRELQETVANIKAWASQSILRCRICSQTDKDM